jgi:hypothetical protein
VLRPELPPELRDVVLKAMARQREDRYPSLRALIEALEPFMVAEPAWPQPELAEAPAAAMTSEPTRTSPGGREAGLPRRSARSRWPLAAFALVAASGALGWFRFSNAASPSGPVAAAPGQATPSDQLGPTAPANTPGPAALAPAALGSDTQAPRTASAAAFASGWVYLGDYRDGHWKTRYFEGFGDELPSRGARISPRGRSYVRLAMPNESGALASARTTIGPDDSVEILELAHWDGGAYVWARVRPVR